MKVLFIHQSFPGQFIHLSGHLAADGKNKVVALGMADNLVPSGVEYRRYHLLRKQSELMHPLLADQEIKVLRAEACTAAMMKLKAEGFVPDVVIAHPGWGESLFVKEVFPRTRLIVYCEFYYATEGLDIDFDPEMPAPSFQQRCQLRMRNAINLLSIEAADMGIAPTQWQKSVWPEFVQHKIQVIHDGIDTAQLKFDPTASIRLGANEYHPELELSKDVPVFSYMARNLEPVRGFHIFMRTLPEVLRQCPDAHALIIGGDGISYGSPPEEGGSWKEKMLRELDGQLDMSRVHFVGQVPYSIWLKTLSITRVHCYWTTPFVLSWSLLEAALAGVPVVASDTPPVREFSDELNIKLVDFFDNRGFAEEAINRINVGGRNELRKEDQYFFDIQTNIVLFFKTLELSM